MLVNGDIKGDGGGFTCRNSEIINRNLTGHAGIYKGIYDLDSSDIGRGLVTYTMLSGLGVPHRRIQALASESEAGSSAIESKKADKTKMSVVEADSSQEDLDRFKSMRTKHSPLGRMMAGRERKP